MILESSVKLHRQKAKARQFCQAQVQYMNWMSSAKDN